MKNKLIMLTLLVGLFSNAQTQEKYCSNPLPTNGVGITTPIVFSITNTPEPTAKYYTTSSISTSGNITTSNVKIYSGTSVSLTNGFKATASYTEKFIAGVGICTTNSSKQANPDNEIITKDFSKNLISLYPNPTHNEVTISWNNNEVINIAVYSFEGRKIHEKEINSKESKTYKYNVQTLSSGVYNVVIQCKDGIITKKLIKD